ncbi:hypothetical protein [Herbiconiux ginsengi]|uniref:Uncharacterized protein n=1 Tax=Herbiconiux ginsengi TaxID=381665 RepID=A0A1H3MX43_9MICO|nr:hypothetical protein [Herbiconiux ginsengi]SDY81020.1 hypothetical protein SAMN05216554_1596 [Herbiconiux ginsengi]
MSGYVTPKSTSYPAPRRTPASKAAAGSLWFALSILFANLLMTMVAAYTLGPGTTPSAGWVVAGVHLAIALALFSFALVFGVKGLRETATGAIRGRGLAIAGIVVAGVLLFFAFGGMVTEIEFAYLGGVAGLG